MSLICESCLRDMTQEFEPSLSFLMADIHIHIYDSHHQLGCFISRIFESCLPVFNGPRRACLSRYESCLLDIEYLSRLQRMRNWVNKIKKKDQKKKRIPEPSAVKRMRLSVTMHRKSRHFPPYFAEGGGEKKRKAEGAGGRARPTYHHTPSSDSKYIPTRPNLNTQQKKIRREPQRRQLNRKGGARGRGLSHLTKFLDNASLEEFGF
jgi:hypothetical protein